MASEEFDHLLERIRSFESPKDPSLEETRAILENTAKLFTVPENVDVRPIDAGGVAAEWLLPADATANASLLYLHGGGYALGSIESHRHMAAQIAEAAGVRTLIIEYRLAPEHPFPAGLEDAVTAYHWLRAEGTAPSDIVISGDSAGGGLTMATLLSLKKEGAAMPAGAALISPWVDLEGTGESMKTKGAQDPIIRAQGLAAFTKYYVGGHDPQAPLASPLYGDLAGLPPLLIHVGSAEVLLDDSTRLAKKATEAGVEVELDVWEEMIHVWHYYAERIPEGRDAIAKIADFIKQRLGIAPSRD